VKNLKTKGFRPCCRNGKKEPGPSEPLETMGGKTKERIAPKARLKRAGGGAGRGGVPVKKAGNKRFGGVHLSEASQEKKNARKRQKKRKKPSLPKTASLFNEKKKSKIQYNLYRLSEARARICA